MRKKFVWGLLTVCCVATGCTGAGTSNNHYSSTTSKDIVSQGIANLESSIASDDFSEESGNEGEEQSETQTEDFNQKKEMLIYSCDVQIDTLDYAKSVSSFKQGLEKLGGFVESEQYSDGASDYGYYVEESEKKKTYTATVRVPSGKYDTFVTSMGDLGDVRSQNSTVQNVSQEYHDTEIQLEILESKEKVFLRMLKRATTTEEMLSIENSLTSLQVQIEQLKSRQLEIDTNVAYSYVNVSIREVEKYQEKPKETDTFVKRLRITIAETASSFRDFLEWFLFLVIRLFPYMVIVSIVAVVVHRCKKKWYRKKHPSKEKNLRTVITYETESVNGEKSTMPKANQDEN